MVADRLRRVGVVGAALRAHQLDDRQVGDRRAPRMTAGLEHRDVRAAQRAAELVEQARLAAAGLADHAHQLALAALGGGQQLAEPTQLAVAAHEASERALGDALLGRAVGGQAEELVGGDRIALALDGEAAGGKEPHLAAHQARGGFGDQDLAGGGGLLEPRRHVGGVAHRRVVHAQVVADRADHDEAGVESHAHLELGAAADAGVGAAVAQRTPDGDRRGHRPPRVVLVGQRRAEQRHEAVAEELVDRALVAVDLAHRQLEEAVEQRVHALGPDPLGERRGVGDVAEQHGDLLALALQGRARGQDALGQVLGRIADRGGKGRPVAEVTPALQAELRGVRELGRAVRAAHQITRQGAGATCARPGAGRDQPRNDLSIQLAFSCFSSSPVRKSLVPTSPRLSAFSRS